MSNAELLQLPTYFKSTEKKSMLLMNAEVQIFIRSQQTPSRKQLTLYLDELSNNELLDRTSKVLRLNFFQKRASKNSSYPRKHHKENKGCHTGHPYNKTCLFQLVNTFHQQGQQTRHTQQELVTAGYCRNRSQWVNEKKLFLISSTVAV